jgi:hypothetical protein
MLEDIVEMRAPFARDDEMRFKGRKTGRGEGLADRPSSSFFERIFTSRPGILSCNRCRLARSGTPARARMASC